MHHQRAGGLHGERLRDRHVSSGEARGAAEVGDRSGEPSQGSRRGEQRTKPTPNPSNMQYNIFYRHERETIEHKTKRGQQIASVLKNL